MNYWLDLFTVKTLEEFQKAGAKVSGFRERRFRTCEQIQPGDKLLCYITGISRWVGVLRVTSPVFRSRFEVEKRDRSDFEERDRSGGPIPHLSPVPPALRAGSVAATSRARSGFSKRSRRRCRSG
jgi:hypothetical protein